MFEEGHTGDVLPWYIDSIEERPGNWSLYFYALEVIQWVCISMVRIAQRGKPAKSISQKADEKETKRGNPII